MGERHVAQRVQPLRQKGARDARGARLRTLLAGLTRLSRAVGIGRRAAWVFAALSLAAAASLEAHPQQGRATGDTALVRTTPVQLPHAPRPAVLVVRHAPSDRVFARYLVEAARNFDPRVFPEARAGVTPDASGEQAAALRADTITLLLAADEPSFRRATGGRVPDWGLAVAFPVTSDIVMRSPRLVSGQSAFAPQVLAHELAHVYLGLYLGTSLRAAPRWFQEGLASLAAGEWGLSERVDLALALLTGRPLGLERLEDGFPSSRPAAELAYLESLAAVAYLRGLSGERGLHVLMDNLRRTGDFDRALRRTYGLTYGELQERWRRTIARRYGWAAAAASSWTTWAPAAVLLVLLFVVRRRRYSRRLRELQRVEEREERDASDVGPTSDVQADSDGSGSR